MARLIVSAFFPLALAATGTSTACAHAGLASERGISDAEIEAALDGWGDWHEDAEHGYVWRPRDVGSDWVPYSRGHWQIAAGDRWLWVSDFAWGRVTFHYGRWFDHPWLGWVWVPGYVYAPSWAAIRTSDEWLSWAPLPPGPCYQGSRLVAVIADAAWSFGRYHRSRRAVHRVPRRPPSVARWVVHPRPTWHREPPRRALQYSAHRAHHDARVATPRVQRQPRRVNPAHRFNRVERAQPVDRVRRARSSPRRVEPNRRLETSRPTRRVERSRQPEVRRRRSGPVRTEHRVRRATPSPGQRIESSRDRRPRRVRSTSSAPRVRRTPDARPRVRRSAERTPRRVQRSQTAPRVRRSAPPTKVRRRANDNNRPPRGQRARTGRHGSTHPR